MTTGERLDGWKAAGVISEAEHATLAALARGDRFSVFVELSVLLYLGVLALVAGLGWTFRDYVTDLGHAAIVSILALIAAAAFGYCFSRGPAYSHDEVESPSFAFDYVLYFGALVFSALLAYLETQLGLFGGWDMHLLLASVVFGGLAYRFDNRFVLSLALSTLAGYLGLTLDLFEILDTNRLRLTAMAYALLVAGVGGTLHRLGIKRHFFDVFLHVATNVMLLAMLSGIFEPAIGLLYLAMLLALAGAAIYLGVRHRRFAFVAYGTLYGYVGFSLRLLSIAGGFILGLFYFSFTGTLVVIGLVMLARRFGRDA